MKRHAGPIVGLNQRELDILTWSARGLTSHEIAEKLELSKRTVDSYIDSARNKLQAATRTQAVVEAINRKLIKP
jgi:DNA-binding NarL/FixJ family response regulator